MDAEIEFGEVEQERPRVMRRPDENRQFAVLPCGEVREAELRVYVDLDAMIDMENHAQTNTNVELGGVMLGGQYVDQEGRPFVVVSDCLRADHYEATKGSFKFTHETWGDIQRRLEEFPEDLRMVGWYHTHPDWGVFLSGMDNFICENFFNKPLDVALVIDPCRYDRGWFQWTNHSRRGPVRMGAFYLTTSRFREEELQYVAQALAGSDAMPLATRGGSQTSGGYGAPVVNVVQDRSSSWIQAAVMGSLALQTVLVAVVTLALLVPRGPSMQVAELEKEKLQLTARRETLKEIAARMGNDDEDLVKSLEETEMKRKALETALASATLVQEQQKDRLETLNAGLKKKDDEYNKLLLQRDKTTDELKAVKAQVSKQAAADKEGDAAKSFDWKSPWVWVVAVVAIALGVLGVVIFRTPNGNPPDSTSSHTEAVKESPSGTNTNPDTV